MIPAVPRLAEYLDQFGRAKLPTDMRRRAKARRRIMIDNEDFRTLIEQRIDEVYDLPNVRDKVKRFVTTAVNPLQMIADRIAVAYRVPPTRSIVGNADASETWAKLMKEAKLATKAKLWGRYAFISNVCHVMPWPVTEPGKPAALRYVTLTADHCDVGFSDDPEVPDCIWFDINGTADLPKAAVCFVDADAWHYIDSAGNVLQSLPHDLGVAPFTTFRVKPPPPGAYWDEARGERMVDATLDVCRLVAAMGWVRKDQNRKLMSMFGEMERVPNEQSLQPEHPIMADASPNDVNFQIHDLNTPASQFLEEINFHMETIADSFGVPLYVLDPSTGNMPGAELERSARAFSAISELRDQQVEMLREAETDLAYKTALVADKFGHPLAVAPETVKDGFEVTFAPLTFITHPRERMAYYVEAIKLGLLDQASAYQQEHPDLTIDQAEARVMEHAERRARINEFQAQRNLPSDPALDNASLAARQGATGGRPATGSGDNSDSPDSEETNR